LFLRATIEQIFAECSLKAHAESVCMTRLTRNQWKWRKIMERKKSTHVTRVIFGKTYHVTRGGIAHFLIDWGIHAIEIILACALIFICGYIAG